MNYEDRTDLKPPNTFISRNTLDGVASAWPHATAVLNEAFRHAKPLNDSVERLLAEVIRPGVELEGAPPQAWPLGLAAARAGYRSGALILAGTDELAGDASGVADIVHQVQAYDLYPETHQDVDRAPHQDVDRAVWSKLAKLIADVGAPERGDFEVEAMESFSLGLATAIVQFDRVRGTAGH